MRHLRRSPGFTLSAVLTLAAGVAAVVTMFTVYWSVVLNPIRIPDADRVVSIARAKRDPQVPTLLSWPRVQAIRRATSLTAVAAYANASVSLSGIGGLPRDLRGLRVSAGFFDAIGAAPARGRLLQADDDVPNGPAVCVLSYETWQGLFGGDAVLGRTIRLAGRSTEIVGVLAPRLTAPWGDRQIFLPRVFDDAQLTPAAGDAGASYLSAVGRLAAGRTRAQATEELRAVSREFASRFTGRSDTINEVEIEPLSATVVANRGSTLALLLGAVLIVLLVACANVAALVLSRLVSRQREIAVRQALGATPAAIVRHVMAENLALALLAGVAGVAIAAAALRVIEATLGAVLPPGADLRIGGPALGVAALAVAVAALLVGIAPAIEATRRSSAAGVTSFARGMSDGRAAQRFRRGLVIGEVALSAFLLVGAALFITSLARALRTPVGFDPSNVAAATVTLPSSAYPDAETQRAFFLDVLDRLRRVPQVEEAAVVFGLPFASENWVSPYVVGGRAIPPPAERRRAGLRSVTEDYLSVMRTRLIAGRFFSAADRAGAHPVCVINQSLARREFGDRSPLGATIRRGRDADQVFEVVGVIADIRTNGPNNAAPDELFLPFRQVPRPSAALVVRTSARPEAMAALLQSAVAAVNPDLPVSGFATMDETLAATLGPERILAELTSAFALVALLLASVGLYAVLAHSVATRTVEIGIRMALGAAPRSVLRMVVSGAMRLVAIGITMGLLASVAASRLVTAQLHGISARDPLIYALVAAIFACIGAAASLLPARRATRVDPLISLNAS